MSELPDGPDDEADLIAAQYADRPQLRPVLEAVLAALPALGPVTVQSRKTLVSLSTPRRVFAVVQPTTRTRVDLGLRLEHERPGGRLLAARDLGASTVRIPLTGPGEVDAEVVGWLRRAYQESAAPPGPRGPARRQAPQLGSATVVIEASGMPGRSWPPGGGGEHGNLHIALCIKNKERPALVVPGKPWLALDPVPGDSPSARWEAVVTVRRDADGLDFSGPYVRGDRTDRNLFLAWGDVRDDGTLLLIRGSKLKLNDVDPRLIEEAMRPGRRLVARIRLTGAEAEPALTWSAEPADVTGTRSSPLAGSSSLSAVCPCGSRDTPLTPVFSRPLLPGCPSSFQPVLRIPNVRGLLPLARSLPLQPRLPGEKTIMNYLN